ncbi:MAG: TolC family protein, partial [Boseongicola sp.]|nr:TolC family protein [Boseongicola sp.]
LRLELSRDAEGRSDTAVRLGVAIPLNDREPRVEYVRARNGLLKAERNVTELRESIRAALRQALNEVEAGLLLAGMAGDARALAERNLAVEEAKFGQGLSSTFEVGAAEGELVRAEQAEADAILALLAAQTRLDRISGRTLERWGIRLKEDAR